MSNTFRLKTCQSEKDWMEKTCAINIAVSIYMKDVLTQDRVCERSHPAVIQFCLSVLVRKTKTPKASLQNISHMRYHMQMSSLRNKIQQFARKHGAPGKWKWKCWCKLLLHPKHKFVFKQICLYNMIIHVVFVSYRDKIFFFLLSETESYPAVSFPC